MEIDLEGGQGPQWIIEPVEKREVTDETWIFQYDPQTKRRSSQRNSQVSKISNSENMKKKKKDYNLDYLIFA